MSQPFFYYSLPPPSYQLKVEVAEARPKSDLWMIYMCVSVSVCVCVCVCVRERERERERESNALRNWTNGKCEKEIKLDRIETIERLQLFKSLSLGLN